MASDVDIFEDGSARKIPDWAQQGFLTRVRPSGRGIRELTWGPSNLAYTRSLCPSK